MWSAGLARYIVPFDKRAVLTYLGVVCKMLGAVLLAPFVVAFLAREVWYGAVFGGVALSIYGLGWIGSRVVPPQRSTLELKEALAVTALAYLLFGLTGALAFLPVASFIDGFFESMSGFTTTGLSVLDVASLPVSLLFFRAYAQWIGGAGIIVLSLAVFLGPGKAAFQLYASEFSEANLLGSVVATARVVAMIYVGLTALGFLVYVAVGMTPFAALLHVMSTLSTGGFSPYPESMGHYASPLVKIAVIVFMLVGATSFSLFYLARSEGLKCFWRDRQLRTLLALSGVAMLFFFALQGWPIEAFESSLFEATSALTTTGFTVRDAASGSEGSKLLIVLLMVFGGATGSTAGGIKLFRVLLLWQLVHWLIMREFLPREAQIPIKYGELVVSDNELRQHGGFVILYLAFLFLSTLCLTLAGFSVMDALFESASALGTVGLSAGITSTELSAGSKLLLIVDMWAGRLEILPVLVIFYPGSWRTRRRAV